ncbi:leucine-rich repeat-containing protein 56 isoform X1 [Pimephales promelas]|uniref:leucine-rich repeat-containing protein 56 isoform X1 n=1 Tax=Pimephales promelas TaxID=90988 RepID=UPI0019556631|nr:leucine-rich repeat-containing protein 56 isoform X1 [Pimephales promelas]
MSSEASQKNTVDEFISSNPKPAGPDISDLMMDQLCLSPEKLKILTGSENLQEVKSLEMCVDTRQDTLDNFGIYLPKLTQLKMNNSLISSVRDLGTRLSHLQVLWLSRCGLTDLEGIPALASLKELYVAYNSISDLTPVSMLEHLELLDLEGNNVDDLAQLMYLGCCGKLRTLSLEGNPVCTCPSPGMPEVLDYNYRSAVCEMIPQLSFLDDVPAEEDKPQCCRTSQQDWTHLKESIKDGSVNDSLENTNTDREERCDSVCGVRPASAQPLNLKSSSRPGSARPFTSCSWSRPGSPGLDIAILNQEASDLTKGSGSVFCGNPLQVVRVRRQKTKLRTPQLSSYVPEHTYSYEESSSEDRSGVFAELRSWRIEHNKHLLAFEDRQPQVMRIHHSDDDYDDEGSHNHSFSSDDITKDRTVCRDTSSPDSSVQSPSPECLEMLRLTSSSGCSMSPSPPVSAAAPPAGRRITQTRIRRLRPHSADISKARPSEETPGPDLRNLCPHSIMTVSSQTVSPQVLHKPHRPSASPAVSPLRAQRSEDTRNHQYSDIQHKPITLPNTFPKLTPRRPQTANAALQRLPEPNLLPTRGNTH